MAGTNKTKFKSNKTVLSMGLSFFILAAVFLSGCSLACKMDDYFMRKDMEKYEKNLQDRLDAIDYSDGINQEEAEVLAEDYLNKHRFMSGWQTAPIDAGDYWNIKLMGCVGNVEEGIPPVVIDKKTGEITWECEYKK